MKVICINNGMVVSEAGALNSAPQLVSHKVYKVKSEHQGGYVLEGVEVPEPYTGFSKSRFVRVPERSTKSSAASWQFINSLKRKV